MFLEKINQIQKFLLLYVLESTLVGGIGSYFHKVLSSNPSEEQQNIDILFIKTILKL